MASEPMTSEYHTDVLIVGAGPVGVTLALLLASRGVSVIVIDKDAAIYSLPRAAHLDHEAIRILQEAGVAEAVVRSSRQSDRYDFLNAAGEVLLRFDGAAAIGAGGWPVGNMIHQPSVEALLRARLAECPGAVLHCGWELTAFATTSAGIGATVATANGPTSVSARYLVGADGARSLVRKAAGIEFEDLGFEEPWLVVDAIVHDPTRLPTANLQICDPERPTTCVLMGKDRHRWEFMIKPGEIVEDVASDERIAQFLAKWDVAGAISLERKAIYTFRARIARLWRQGPVLLAGDAAHQTPPFAGQGLCSGLRDAANLAWKLAAIINDHATDALLDSYQPEREPNLRATIAMAIMMGQTVCITDPDAAATRDAQMLAARAAGHAPDGAIVYPPIESGCILPTTAAAGAYFPQAIADDGSGRRLDDVMGQGPWLLSRLPVDATDGLVVMAIAAPAIAPFRSALEKWLDAQGSDAVLVRPDRFVFGTGTAAMLGEAWNRLVRASRAA